MHVGYSSESRPPASGVPGVGQVRRSRDHTVGAVVVSKPCALIARLNADVLAAVMARLRREDHAACVIASRLFPPLPLVKFRWSYDSPFIPSALELYSAESIADVAHIPQHIRAVGESGRLDVVRVMCDRARKAMAKPFWANSCDIGHVSVERWYVTFLAQGAASMGHVGLVEYLYSRDAGACTSTVVDTAADSLNLAVIEFCHRRRLFGDFEQYMTCAEKAAAQGVGAVVHFICDAVEAMSAQYQRPMRRAKLSAAVLVAAADNNHTDLALWAMEYAGSGDDNASGDSSNARIHACLSSWMPDHVLGHGHANVWHALRNASGLPLTPTAVAGNVAARNGHIDVIECLWSERDAYPNVITTSAIDEAVAGRHCHIVNWLYEHLPHASKQTRVLDPAAADVGMLRCLRAHIPKAVSLAAPRLLELAAAHGCCDVLRMVIDEVGVTSGVGVALGAAIAGGQYGAACMLYAMRSPEPCPLADIVTAAERGSAVLAGIGINHQRHASPDTFRADARHALKAALQQCHSMVVGVLGILAGERTQNRMARIASPVRNRWRTCSHIGACRGPHGRVATPIPSGPIQPREHYAFYGALERGCARVAAGMAKRGLPAVVLERGLAYCLRREQPLLLSALCANAGDTARLLMRAASRYPSAEKRCGAIRFHVNFARSNLASETEESTIDVGCASMPNL